LITFQLDPESREETLRSIAEMKKRLTENSDPQQTEFQIMNDSIKYKDAGVDIDAANRTTERIKKLARSTFNEHVLSEIGGFGGMFNGIFPDTREPVWSRAATESAPS